MSATTFTSKLLIEGFWYNIPWQFWVDPKLPGLSLCTAAFCIVTYQGKLLLPQHILRGVEFPGGHINPGETSEEAVRREVFEETGARITDLTFFGYKSLRPENPIPHRDDPNRYYPFPVSYLPYYVAEADSFDPAVVLTDDITKVELATLEQAYSLLSPAHHHDVILKWAMEHELITL